MANESAVNSLRIRVWDAPTRIFHWSLVLAFSVAMLTSESERWRDLHVTAGYTLAGLLAFRLLWGAVGSRYSRFSEFWPRPQAIIDYVESILAGKPQHFVGHNPLGAIAIFLLLGLGASTALSGWLLYQEFGGHRLGEVWEEMHEAFAYGMLTVVAIHLCGVAVSSVLHGENLVAAMLTGYKERKGADNESVAGRG